MNSYSRISLLATCGVAILLIGCRGSVRQEKAKVVGTKSPQSFNQVRKAAEKGDAKAQFELAEMYFQGEGVAQDSDEGIRWCRKAADHGNAQALMYLAHGVDPAEAARLHRKAADLGDAEAQFILGEDYYGGRGVPRDKEAAIQWYQQAAERGHLQAQLYLATMYSSGEASASKPNYGVAAYWFRMAADQGDANAQGNLGIMYRNGDGVIQDYAEAVRLCSAAADKGESFAQATLGEMYQHGQGVIQDYVKAHMWFNIAASRALFPFAQQMCAKQRDLVASKMTPAQVAEAQRMAREWKPQRQAIGPGENDAHP